MKGKTLVKGLLVALIVIVTVGLIAGIFIKKAPAPEHKVYDYQISYIRADTGEDIMENYKFMLKKTGTYPIGYNANSATFTISDLKGKMEPAPVAWGEFFKGTYVGTEVSDPEDKKKSYGFYGWFLDQECTVEFEGTVHEGAAENLTVYAKILESRWTGSY